jgi:hypothetical protein
MFKSIKMLEDATLLNLRRIEDVRIFCGFQIFMILRLLEEFNQNPRGSFFTEDPRNGKFGISEYPEFTPRILLSHFRILEDP